MSNTTACENIPRVMILGGGMDYTKSKSKIRKYQQTIRLCSQLGIDENISYVILDYIASGANVRWKTQTKGVLKGTSVHTLFFTDEIKYRGFSPIEKYRIRRERCQEIDYDYDEFVYMTVANGKYYGDQNILEVFLSNGKVKGISYGKWTPLDLTYYPEFAGFKNTRGEDEWNEIITSGECHWSQGALAEMG